MQCTLMQHVHGQWHKLCVAGSVKGFRCKLSSPTFDLLNIPCYRGPLRMFFDWKVKMRRFALSGCQVFCIPFSFGKGVSCEACANGQALRHRMRHSHFLQPFVFVAKRSCVSVLEPLRVEWRELHALDSFHAYWSS